MAYNFLKDRIFGFGIVLGCIALVVLRYCGPNLMETWYGQGLFKAVRLLLDYTFGLLPLPGTYLLFFLLLWLIIRSVRKGRWRKIIVPKLIWRMLGILGFLFTAFYFLWGFNYGRADVTDRLSWNKEKLDKKTLVGMSEKHIAELNVLRQQLDPSQYAGQTNSWKSQIRKEAYPLAARLGYDPPGRNLRAREWKPVGLLLRLGTAGFYNPLTGECNIDGGLHDLQKPFVLAHEYFHGLGVTGEGDCNFLAYVLCHDASDPFIRYSGELGFWRYLRSALYRNDPEKFGEVASLSIPEVNEDLADIEKQMDKFPDIAPRVRDKVYDTYLKSNKIEEGMASYGNVVGMVLNWKRNNKQL